MCDFLRFQISEKWANLRLPLNVQTQKVFQLQGATPLWPPTRGSALGPRWGLRPQTPFIGSRSARSPSPLLPNPKYATGRTATLTLNPKPIKLNFKPQF